jgi:ferredoxin
VAVGLDPVNEFYEKAREFSMPVYAAGDAEEIAEASAAIFSGKIRGLEIAKSLGYKVGKIPTSWYQTGEILKSRPGRTVQEELPEIATGVSPVIHCTQEIPCDPCASICPQGLIYIDRRDIRQVPTFLGNNYCCGVCERCVAICPGLAITLVDYRNNPDLPTVSIPFEFARGSIAEGDTITVTDTEGTALGKLEVIDCTTIPSSDRTMIIRVIAPAEYARQIAGIRIQDSKITQPMDHYVQSITNDTIVCRCERVSAGEIRELIRQGYRDMNEIKAVSKAGMGACGAKTCNALIHRLFRDEGIPLSDIHEQTRRPLFIETPLGVFAGVKEGDNGEGG